MDFQLKTKFRVLIGICLLGRAAYGQTDAPPPGTSPSSLSAIQQAFVQEQATLSEEQEALISQGATSQQLEAWAQQHATELATQLAQAQILGAASYMNTEPYTTQVQVPETPTGRQWIMA